jgi:hypothetical protein
LKVRRGVGVFAAIPAVETSVDQLWAVKAGWTDCGLPRPGDRRLSLVRATGGTLLASCSLGAKKKLRYD